MFKNNVRHYVLYDKEDIIEKKPHKTCQIVVHETVKILFVQSRRSELITKLDITPPLL